MFLNAKMSEALKAYLRNLTNSGRALDDYTYFNPVDHPPNVYEKVDKNGNGKHPPEYVYNPDGNPGNDKDREALRDADGNFWVEDTPPGNVWIPVDDNGNLDEDHAVWGGSNGKPGDGDDKPVNKFNGGWWVDMGQNVWKKVNGRFVLGLPTGGGPSKNPASTDGRGRPIYEHDGKYYLVVGVDAEGNTYYYGDSEDGNGLLDSTRDGLEEDDVIYYKDANDNMVTEKPNNIIEGEDGNYYRPVGKPRHVFEKVNADGNSKNPPEYVYNPDDAPGNGSDREVIRDDNGVFWVEDDPPGNVWIPINDNGSLNKNNAVWGGGDGKPGGGGDDNPVSKFTDGNWWLNMGQNVWKKIINKSTFGELTGGGPDRNPASTPGVPIYEHNGKYFIKAGKDLYGNDIYYGDPVDGNQMLDSTIQGTKRDDVIYYKDEYDNMTTEQPLTVVSVTVHPPNRNMQKGDSYTFSASVLLSSEDSTADVIWELSPSPADAGGTMYSVNSTGTVTVTIGAGETVPNYFTLTAAAAANNNIKGYAYITVTDRSPTYVQVVLEPSHAEYTIGDSPIPFTANVSGNDLANGTGNEAVTWKVEPAAVGVSIAGGLFTAAVPGVYTVTATAKDDLTASASATVAVSLRKPSVVNVMLDPPSATIKKSTSMQLYASVSGNGLVSGSGNSAVYWAVDVNDPLNVIITDTGEFVSHKAGTYTITVTAKDDSSKKATATVTVIDDLINIGNGAITVIDNREWIKVRNNSPRGKNYVLLMLKDVIGPWDYGPDYKTNLQYADSSIRNYVTGWYDNFGSPTLESMAVQAMVGTAPNESWPAEGDTGIIAHLPRKVDFGDLSIFVRVIEGIDYWLANPACIDDACVYQETVRSDGEYGKRLNSGIAYARPIVWVKAPTL
jgi:hypothetical protein